MPQTQILPPMEILDRYNVAAADLAVCVDVMDHIANDPTHPADRSEAATSHRNRVYADALATFRAAKDALLSSVDARELRRPAHVTEALMELDA